MWQAASSRSLVILAEMQCTSDAILKKAAEKGARILHTSEACLSGFANEDIPSFAGYDWTLLRREITSLRTLAAELGL